MTVRSSFAFLNYLAILLLLSCDLTNEKNSKPVGFWGFCSKDGVYVEMYITDKSITFQQPEGFHQNYFYSLKGDTIKYYRQDTTFPNSKDTLTAFILSVDDSSMVWTASNRSEEWIFKKLSDKIELPSLTKLDLESLKKYNEAKRPFLDRASKAGCADNRSREEIIQDSLRINSFKF